MRFAVALVRKGRFSAGTLFFVCCSYLRIIIAKYLPPGHLFLRVDLQHTVAQQFGHSFTTRYNLYQRTPIELLSQCKQAVVNYTKLFFHVSEFVLGLCHEVCRCAIHEAGALKAGLHHRDVLLQPLGLLAEP